MQTVLIKPTQVLNAEERERIADLIEHHADALRIVLLDNSVDATVHNDVDELAAAIREQGEAIAQLANQVGLIAGVMADTVAMLAQDDDGNVGNDDTSDGYLDS